jgi:hypothetical protein
VHQIGSGYLFAWTGVNFGGAFLTVIVFGTLCQLWREFIATSAPVFYSGALSASRNSQGAFCTSIIHEDKTVSWLENMWWRDKNEKWSGKCQCMYATRVTVTHQEGFRLSNVYSEDPLWQKLELSQKYKNTYLVDCCVQNDLSLLNSLNWFIRLIN